ncbi:MAG: NERD domain-containing protein [Bacillota bacterium]
MPARVMRQNKEIKELFRQKIKEKVAREKEKRRNRIDEELPSWISWALKPVADLAFEMRQRRDSNRGEGGEDRAAFNFWLFLSKDWVLVNDVVLEPKPDEFIQVDHILIGPPGVCLIETKAWEGAFSGYKDNWRRKEGSSWVRCESPTKQNKRHVRLFKEWLENTLGDRIPAEIEAWLFPVVLFTRAKWLRVEECSMPVFESGMGLAWHIRRQTKNVLLGAEQINAIAGALVDAKPLMGQNSGAVALRDPETGWCYKNGGRAPAGYRNIRVQRGVDPREVPILKQLWEPDPEWAEILRYIVVELKIKRRMSHVKIVEHLNNMGIRSPEGRPICVSFITELFREDRLLQAAGYAFWNREDRKAIGRRLKPRDEWVMVPNAHPAIITEEEARLAREVCGQKHYSRIPPRLHDSPWLLTGKNLDGEDFFVCTACGGRMASYIKSGRYISKYRCGTVTYQGKGACYDVKIPKEWIEGEIVNCIRERFGPQEIDALVQQVAKAIEAETVQYRKAVRAVEKAITDKKREIDNLVAAVARGTNVDLYNEAIEVRRKEIEGTAPTASAAISSGLSSGASSSTPRTGGSQSSGTPTRCRQKTSWHLAISR